MAKKLSRIISLCMVFLMIFMASLQENAYAYKPGNGNGNAYGHANKDQTNDINWGNGVGIGDDFEDERGKLSFKNFDSDNLSGSDWVDRSELFKGEQGKRYEVEISKELRLENREVGIGWGYFIPERNGYYNFGIRGNSGHFGMLFDKMDAVSDFNNNKSKYYAEDAGYENDGALVIGNAFPGADAFYSTSEMMGSSNQRRYVELKKGCVYPVYIEYYNSKNENGSLEMFYRYKTGKGSWDRGEFSLSNRAYEGEQDPYMSIYPSNEEFITHERVPNGINIDWEPGLSGSNDLESNQRGILSNRDYMTEHIKYGEWDDRGVIFSGSRTGRYLRRVYEKMPRRKDSVGVLWGYLIPRRDGYYSFGMRGENTAHYGMVFNSIEAVSKFDNDKDAYYFQNPGFEKDGALVIGNDFAEGDNSRYSEMIDSSGERIYVKLSRNKIYPIYIQYYNDEKYWDGNIGMFYRYKSGKYEQDQGFTVLDHEDDRGISIYSSSKDFINERGHISNGININWNNPNSDYDEVDDAWRLSYKRIYSPEMKEDDWKDRYELFGGQFTSIYEGDVKRMGPNGLENVGPAGVFENSRGLVWGYIEPQQSGYYSFSIFGQYTGKFGMLFEDMDGVKRFDSNKEAFYDKSSGYEQNGMLVMGNEFRPVYGHGETDMVNSDGERIFVKLEQGKKYPVYMEYFNSSKNSSGSIGLNYYYKSEANDRPIGSLMLGFDSKLKTYSSNEDFVSFEKPLMPEDLTNPPGYLNEQYFSIDGMPSISNELKWTDKSLIYSDSKRIGESSLSYAGTVQRGASDLAERGYKVKGERYTFFDWVRYSKEETKMIKKTWGYIVPKENIDRIAILSDDGVSIEIREVNPETGEKTLISRTSSFKSQLWGGVITPKLNLKAGKAYDIYIEYFNWGGQGRFVMLYNGSQGDDYIETRSGGGNFYKNLIKDAQPKETLGLKDNNKIEYSHGEYKTYMKTIPAMWFFPTLSQIDATDLKNAMDNGNHMSDRMSDASYIKNYDADLYARLNTVLEKAQEVYDGRYKVLSELDHSAVQRMFDELLGSKDKSILKSRHVDGKYQKLIDRGRIKTTQDLIDAMTIITREAILDFQKSVKMTGLEAEYDSEAGKYDFTWDEFKGAKQYELSLIDGGGKVTAIGLIDASSLSTSGGKVSYEYAHGVVAGADFRVRAVLDEAEFTFKYTGYSNTANDQDAAEITSANKTKGINEYEDMEGNVVKTKYGQEIVPVVEFNINSDSIYDAKIQIDVKGNSLMTYKYPKIRLIRQNGENSYQSKGFVATISQDGNSYSITIDPDESHLEKGRYMVEIDTAMTIEDSNKISEIMNANSNSIGGKVGNWRFPYVIESLKEGGNGSLIKDGLSIDTTISWNPSEASNTEDRRSYSDESIKIDITNKNELPGSF